MSGLYLVADDLTGALDSAVAFSGRFGPIPVFLGAPHDNASVHAAVSLATRDGSPEFARMSIELVAPRLAKAEIPYKKIDSLLRGQWAIELAGLMKSGAYRCCVFAPAFPSQGRTTQRGRQVIRTDGTVCGTIPIDPAEVLEGLGVRVVHATAQGAANLSVRTLERDVVVFDAATDEDLRAIVAWGHRQGMPVLWSGSAGLARALAHGDVPPTARFGRPILAVIGSDHAVSKAQIAHVVAQGSTPCVVIGEDVGVAAQMVTDAFSRTGRCVVSFGFEDGTKAKDASISIQQKLRVLLRQIARPASLLVSGGETLLSVCRALGAEYLEVDAEIAPGVPRSKMHAGRWDRVDVVSKSGGFGHPYWIADMIAKT